MGQILVLQVTFCKDCSLASAHWPLTTKCREGQATLIYGCTVAGAPYAAFSTHFCVLGSIFVYTSCYVICSPFRLRTVTPLTGSRPCPPANWHKGNWQESWTSLNTTSCSVVMHYYNEIWMLEMWWEPHFDKLVKLCFSLFQIYGLLALSTIVSYLLVILQLPWLLEYPL